MNRELLSQTEAQVVLSCSAQKETYRERLFKGLPDKRIIYLHGSADLLRRRMEARSDHFMPVALLEGQIAIMEKPALCLSIDVGLPLESVIGKAIAYCR